MTCPHFIFHNLEYRVENVENMIAKTAQLLHDPIIFHDNGRQFRLIAI